MSLIDNIKKLVTPAPQTVDELRPVIHEAAAASYRIDALQAQFDQHAAVVAKEYGGAIAALKKQYASLEKTILKYFAAHREEFGKARTVHIDGHAVALRNTPGKVVCTLGDSMACDAIVATGDNELILGALNVSIVPDKNTIKAILESGGPMADTLTEIGFSVQKGETLTFKPAEQTNDATAL